MHFDDVIKAQYAAIASIWNQLIATSRQSVHSHGPVMYYFPSIYIMNNYAFMIWTTIIEMFVKHISLKT